MTQQPWGQPGGQQPWGRQGAQQPWGQPAGQWPQPSGQPAWGRPATGWNQPTPYPGYPVPGGAAPQQQPPRRGAPFQVILLGAVAVLAVGFFFLSLMNYLNSDQQASPLPQIGDTSAPPLGVPEPDFDPPELPMPKTFDEAEQWLASNALYQESVAVPTNCTLGRMDVVDADSDELEEHLTTLTGCLMMVWQDPLERAGFAMPRPPVTVYSQPITTACGEVETRNAVYCSGDQRIYYATDLPQVFSRTPEVANIQFMADVVIGHEFGHAIQARTGILISSVAFEQRVAEDEAVWFSRRSEQQADCLSGMFINAVSQASRMSDAEQQELRQVMVGIGDDTLTGIDDYQGDHGQGANRERWFVTGLESNQAGVCNTWVVENSQVR